MIGVEQWRASIGLYHPHSHRCVPGKRQLAPILPIYHLVGVTLLVLILAKQLVCCIFFIIWVQMNGYSLLKRILTHIMVSKKRTSDIQLLMCAIRQAVTETISGCLERSIRAMAIEASSSPMIGVEQWRASIGLYHPRSHCRVPGKRQLAPILPIYHLVGVTLLVLILARLLVCFIIWIRINGYSLLNEGLTRIMASNKRTSGTQLLVYVCAIRQAVTEVHSGCLERSAKAMAILLIMAGDVEQNPGPLPPASSTPESRALHYHSASLITAIADPLRFSWKLFAAGIIEKTTKNKANLPRMTTDEKNDVLITAVMDRVDMDPSLFHRFVDLLKDDGDDILKCLGGKLEDTYNEFTKGDTERCTLNPPPAKQQELSRSHIEIHHPSQFHPQPPHSHSQPSHDPSQHACMNPYDFEEFQMHLPHSQSPHLHTPPTKQIQHSPPHPMKQAQHSPSPAAEHSPQSPFQFFAGFLRDFYGSEVPLSYCKWPHVRKKKYINLAAISREKVTSTELKRFMLSTLHGNVDEILETKEPIKLQDILEAKPGETLHCVLVEGAPGVGKTTLSWEICKRWAKGELFLQYSVVMLLRLRDRTVQNAKSIMDIIHYMYVNEDNEDFRINVSQHIERTKGKDTLIILEGLDELPKHLINTDQPSIFTHLLSRKILPKATILVTSRPSATAQLREGWEISRHIEILGFTEKDITDYIHNAVSPEELSAFDSYLTTNPNIRLTMYIPLNCAIVVEVYRSCQQSGYPPPKTVTELYTCLVQTILLRYLDSHPHYKDSTINVEKFSGLPPPVYQYFCKLTQMAYDGVQSQQLIFHDQHTSIEHLGFMDTVTELFPTKHKATYSFNFLHLSLQEYLAAHHVSLQSMDVQQKLLQSTLKEQHLRNMGRFVAGITKYQGMDRATVKAVIEQEGGKGYGGSLELSPYTLQLLHECGDYSIIDGHPSYSCTLADYSPLLDFAVLGHCIANSSYKWTLELGGYGNYMQSTERITMLVQTLKSHSNPSYTIERIECWYDAPECVQCLLLELPQHALQYIQELWLYSNRHNRHPLPLPVLELILSKMSRLHSLRLYWGAISTAGAVAMAELIKNNNTLREMDLFDNAIDAKGVEALEKMKIRKKDLRLIIEY